MRWRNAELLIRSKADRCLQKNDDDIDTPKLWSTTRRAKVIGTIEFDLPARDDMPARHVKQEVRVARVKLAPPTSSNKRSLGYPPVEVTAVLTTEIDPPEGVKPLEWLLLGSKVTHSKEDAIEFIKWYLCRWEIEIYFKVLKSGCKIEALQLETSERTEPCIALYMIIAWRILFLTMLGRTSPHISCDIIFHEAEWKSVFAVTNKSCPPENPPSLGQMIKMIASLGGFLNRKHDGDPGPKTMWNGMKRMRCLAIGWEAATQFNGASTCG